MTQSHYEKQLAGISNPERFVASASLAVVRADAAETVFRSSTNAPNAAGIATVAAAAAVMKYVDTEYARRDALLTRYARLLALLEELRSWPAQLRAWLGLQAGQGREGK